MDGRMGKMKLSRDHPQAVGLVVKARNMGVGSLQRSQV